MNGYNYILIDHLRNYRNPSLVLIEWCSELMHYIIYILIIIMYIFINNVNGYS